MSSGHVLILVKAKGCGACINYEPVWEKLYQKIKDANPGLRIIVNTADTIRGGPTKDVPSTLRDIVKWYPVMIMVPGQFWDSAMEDHIKKRTPPPFSTAKVINGSVEKVNGKYTCTLVKTGKRYNIMDVDSINEWIRTSVSEFNGSNPSNTPNLGSVSEPFKAASPFVVQDPAPQNTPPVANANPIVVQNQNTNPNPFPAANTNANLRPAVCRNVKVFGSRRY